MKKNTFRILLLLSLLLPFLSVAAALVIPNENLDKISDYISELEAEYNRQLLSDLWMAVTAGVVLAVVAASYVGLFMFKSWARHLFVVAFVLMIPTYFSDGVYVSTGLADLLHDISNLLSGGLIALMYTGPIKQFFVEPDIEQNT